MPRAPIINVIGEQDRIRRKLIKSIQKQIGGKLITYTVNRNISPNFIDHNDIRFFNDLLESCGDVDRLILMINSPGGELDAAEKIAMMCRAYCKEFFVLVPESAKSAATMIALTADKILMGYLSSLGPIDPQIRVVSPKGGFHYIPAYSYISSFRALINEIIRGTPPKAIIPSLQLIDPALIDVCFKAIESSKQFAIKWLSKYMLKGNVVKAKKIAEDLSNLDRWLSHGKNIDRDTAANLGLTIEKIPKESKLWKQIWELFCRQEIKMNATNIVKHYECDKHSTGITIHTKGAPSQVPSSSGGLPSPSVAP